MKLCSRSAESISNKPPDTLPARPKLHASIEITRGRTHQLNALIEAPPFDGLRFLAQRFPARVGAEAGPGAWLKKRRK